MPLTDDELKDLRERLNKAGLPSTFTGDRLAAFQMGLDVVLSHVQQLSEKKPEDGKKGK